jgi:hypothetical protein
LGSRSVRDGLGRPADKCQLPGLDCIAPQSPDRIRLRTSWRADLRCARVRTSERDVRSASISQDGRCARGVAMRWVRGARRWTATPRESRPAPRPSGTRAATLRPPIYYPVNPDSG